MTKGIRLLTLGLLLLLVMGCASESTFKEGISSLPPLASYKGRIIFYQPSGFLPIIKVNGAKVGESMYNRLLFVDVAPGSQEVTLPTGALQSIQHANKLHFGLDVGQVRYVRVSVSPWGVMYLLAHSLQAKLKLVPPEIAEKEIAETINPKHNVPTPVIP